MEMIGDDFVLCSSQFLTGGASQTLPISLSCKESLSDLTDENLSVTLIT